MGCYEVLNGHTECKRDPKRGFQEAGNITCTFQRADYAWRNAGQGSELRLPQLAVSMPLTKTTNMKAQWRKWSAPRALGKGLDHKIADS